MSSIFEILVILAIVFAQVYIAWITYQGIKEMNGFKIQDSKDFYLDLKKGNLFDQILYRNQKSELLHEIVGRINDYLRNNQGAASDFSLIKDIVERNCDVVEDEINQKLPVPLYLGLMGTVLGIIIGLFSLNPDITNNSFINSVGGLIGGVKFAMIASFCGLLLTTGLSAWLYRGAKQKMEDQKNILYSWIQTNLLPRLTQNATSTILALQANLENFNKGFAQNVAGFNDIMGQIQNAFTTQTNLSKEMNKNLKILNDVDIVKIAGFNAQTYTQLSKSVKQLSQFNDYIGQMNSLVTSSEMLTASIDKKLHSIDDIDKVISSFKARIEENGRIMDNLNALMERLKESQGLVSTSLKEHLETQVEDLKTYTANAQADFKKLVSRNREDILQLNHLEKLDGLVGAIGSMQKSLENQNNRMEAKFTELSKLSSTKIAVIVVAFIMAIIMTVCAFRIIGKLDTLNKTIQNTTAADSTAVNEPLPYLNHRVK